MSKNKKYRNGSYQKAVPDYGEGVNRQVDERGKCEQKRKNGFYRAVLNICLSFLNGRKKRSGINNKITI